MKNFLLLIVGTIALLIIVGVGGWVFGFWEKPSPPPPPLRLPAAAPEAIAIPPSPPPAIDLAASPAPTPAADAVAATQPDESLAAAQERAAADVAAQAAAQAAAVENQRRAQIMRNNLRQLASASQQYMLDKGVTQATYQDVVGTNTDSYIRSITPAADENYQNMVIYQTTTAVSINTSDGLTVIYNL